MSNKTNITNKVYKNLSYLNCFKYNKKSPYTSIYTGFGKNYNTSKNRWQPYQTLFLRRF